MGEKFLLRIYLLFIIYCFLEIVILKDVGCIGDVLFK